ncbi:MAG: hypothetical protein KAR32_06410 [Candidatus Omnitrophica bacterium]|nr:hypothetical protein [Candidatus Omnitrophota bacterium]
MAFKKFTKTVLAVSCLFLTASLFSGCGTLTEALKEGIKKFQPLTPGSKKAMSNVAVVSDMGDIFKGEKAGFLRVGDKSFTYDFSEHNVDTSIEEKIVTQMKSSSDLNVVPRPDLRGLINVNPNNMTHAGYLKQISPLLNQLRSEGVDTAVIVIPWISAYKGFSPVLGYGYTHGFTTDSYAVKPKELFFYSQINVVDVTNNKIVLLQYLNRNEDVISSPWNDRFEDFSPEEKQQMTNFVLNVINKDFPDFLTKMNF